jgi:hypothetical protein
MAEQLGAGEVQASRPSAGMLAGVACVTLPAALLLCAASPWVMRGYGPPSPAATDMVSWSRRRGVGRAHAGRQRDHRQRTHVGRLLINHRLGAATLVGGWYLVRWGAEGLAASRLLAAVIHLAIVLIVFPRLALSGSVVTTRRARRRTLK